MGLEVLLTTNTEHVDDLVFHDQWHRWNIMVAVLALRLDRIHNCRILHLFDWSYWCNISHLLPRHLSLVIWCMGFSVARLQSSSNGLHLVRRAVMDWR